MIARKVIWMAGVLELTLASQALSQPNTTLNVSLSSSFSSPAPVGTSIMWTAKVVNAPGPFTFRFSVRTPAGVNEIVRDYSPVNTLPWTQLAEGSYEVTISVRDSTGGTGTATVSFHFLSRVMGSQPVVSSTANPLVALYSAPPCASGTVHVEFWPVSGGEFKMATPNQNCIPSASLNFYVAGMLPNTGYSVQQVTTVNGTSKSGPLLSFHTGTVNYTLPAFQLSIAPQKGTSLAESILLTSFKAVRTTPPLYPPLATDLKGNVLWYYRDPESPTTPQSLYLTRPVGGGTFLMLHINGALREVDLAGNIVRETNASRISEQLLALKTDTVSWLSHEALRLPNGHTLTLGSAERILTNVQGPGAVDVVGDVIIDLDTNFQVTWSWNSFNFLNTARKAILNEKCGATWHTCGQLKLATVANDWTHANSLLQTSDGNLLISIRDQDYVVKLNYQNGKGDGHVIWTLGNQGDCATPGCTSPYFSITFNDPWPWFSHQHDVEFDGVNYELYDNGNTRISPPPIGLGYGNSRGYVFSVDESKMTVSVQLAVDLGVSCPGFGSAQRLSNGDYQFTNGTINNGMTSSSLEVTNTGSSNYSLLWQTRSYRSFRMKDLYTYTQ